jgi:D-tyrosyl-tRNA(Tyr) deacylase
MRVVVQRVSTASVSIDDEVYSKIRLGLLVLVGIEELDTIEDIVWLAAKIVNMRIFNDDHGMMNKSVADVFGE